MWKNLLLLLSLACVLAIPCSGQLMAGMAAGPSLANVNGVGSGNNKARLGVHAGVLAMYPLADRFLLQGELQYSLKGFRYPTQGYASSGSLSLHYLALPLMGRYRLSEQVAILLGPEFGYLLQAVSRYDGENHDLKEGFRKLDLGLDAGMAFTLSAHWGAEARYSYGFKGLTEGVVTDASGNVVGRGKFGSNQVLQAGIFYLFGGR